MYILHQTACCIHISSLLTHFKKHNNTAASLLTLFQTFFAHFFLFFFCRQSAGRGAHSGLLQGRPEAGQVWGDHLWPGWREKDPGHLEELLLRVARRGVRGGLQRRPEDPGDTGDHGRGLAAPAHRRETSASVSGGTQCSTKAKKKINVFYIFL